MIASMPFSQHFRIEHCPRYILRQENDPPDRFLTLITFSEKASLACQMPGLNTEICTSLLQASV
jgi:hypothetical protein